MIMNTTQLKPIDVPPMPTQAEWRKKSGAKLKVYHAVFILAVYLAIIGIATVVGYYSHLVFVIAGSILAIVGVVLAILFLRKHKQLSYAINAQNRLP